MITNLGLFLHHDSKQCIYIKKDGAVADYFMQGYDERSADDRHPYRKTPQVEKNGDILL